MMSIKHLMVLVVLISFSCKEKPSKEEASIVTENKKVIDKTANTKDTLAILNSIIKKDFSDYKYYKHFKGNIDNDKLEDIVLVVERPCKEEDNSASEESKCRNTIFLKNEKNLNYSIASKDKNIIDCSDCGGAGAGDSFKEITINNGEIIFKSMYGAATKTNETKIFSYIDTKNKWQQTKFISEWQNMEDTLSDGSIKQNTKIKTPKDFGEVYFGD